MNLTNNNSNRQRQAWMFGLFKGIAALVVLILLSIIGYIMYRGLPKISWTFLSDIPRNNMTEGGVFPAIIGTLTLVLGSMLFAFPIGVMSAIFLNEYLKESFVKKIIQSMTDNLSGVPSIVFGLFGMALFVNQLGFGDSILAGSLTLGLLSLPVIIRTTEEALKAVPDGYRQASLALGASKLVTIRRVVLPIAFPNIITGLILSIGRVSGETAPILFTVAAYFLPKLPTGMFDQVMALPYHLFVLATSGTEVEKSQEMAYGAALVLIFIVLITNFIAGFIRRRYSKKNKI